MKQVIIITVRIIVEQHTFCTKFISIRPDANTSEPFLIFQKYRLYSYSVKLIQNKEFLEKN